jgi:hypothetical protein
MNDSTKRAVVGRAWIAPIGSTGPDEWTDLGTVSAADASAAFTWPDSAAISADPLDRDRHRSGMPGDERCGVMGVFPTGPTVGIVTPCWRRPDHADPVHEGMLGTWPA